MPPDEFEKAEVVGPVDQVHGQLFNETEVSFGGNEAATLKAAQDDLAKLRGEIAKGTVNPTEYRSRDLPVDFEDPNVMREIEDTLTQIRDDMIMRAPEPDPKEVAIIHARQAALNDYIKLMPRAYLFMGIAEGYSEKQIEQTFKEHLREIIDKNYNPAKFSFDPMTDEKPPVDIRLSSLSYSREAKAQMYSEMTTVYTAFTDRFESVLDAEDYNVYRYEVVKRWELGLLARLYVERASVEKSTKSPRQIREEYVNDAAQRLIDCVTTPAKRQELMVELQKVLR